MGSARTVSVIVRVSEEGRKRKRGSQSGEREEEKTGKRDEPVATTGGQTARSISAVAMERERRGISFEYEDERGRETNLQQGRKQ